MHVKKIARRSAFLIVALSGVPGLYAQTANNDLGTGTPINAILHGSRLDTIQINNGDLHINIPIWSNRGRGIDTGYSFVYDNKGWAFATHCNTSTGICSDNVITEGGSNMILTPQGPSNYSITYKSSDVTGPSGGGGANPIYYTIHSNYVLREPNGTKHHFVPDPIADDPTNTFGFVTTYTLYADDGSGWMLQVAPPGSSSSSEPIKAVRKDGFTIYGEGSSSYGKIVDANGNYLPASATGSTTGQDTLGRSFNLDGSYVDSTGTLHALTIVSTSVPVKSQQCLYTESDTCTEVQGTWTVPQKITLPNDMSYSFTYEQNQGGEPNSMTLPTGGTIDWGWGTWMNGGRNVTSREVSSGSETGTWTYQYASTGNSSSDICGTYKYTTTVEDPAHNDVKYCLTDVSQSNSGPSVVNDIYYYSGQASGNNIIKHVQPTYQTLSYHSGSYNFSTYLPSGETTTWTQGNWVKKTQTTFETFAVSGSGTFTAGNPADIYDYDYGVGAAGTLLRHIHYDYLHNQNSAYLAANIVGKPVNKYVYDGAGNMVAKTVSGYDNYSLTSITGATNHDDQNFGTGNQVRGNLTAVSDYADGGSTALVRTMYYDTLGNLVQSSDNLQNTTTYTYQDRWSSGTTCLTGSTYAFPTLILNAKGQKTQNTYYGCTGQLQGSQDQNDLNGGRAGTTYQYDLMNQITHVGMPDGGSIDYNHHGYALPYTVTVSRAATPDPTVMSSIQYDGLGQVAQTTSTDSQGNITSETTYDSFGRKFTQTNPHRSAGSSSDGTTQYEYDPLGRISDVIHPSNQTEHTDYIGPASETTDEGNGSIPLKKVLQVDGLGRLTSVCEVSATTQQGTDNTPAGCGQAIPETGFLTKYTYNARGDLSNVTQGGVARSYSYDWLSRLTYATNPEVNAAAAIEYHYTKADGSGLCSGSSSDVCWRKDPRGIVTTYTYSDSLNRLTNITYSDSTPARHFAYDETSKWSVTLGNPIGRLTSESVGSGSVGQMMSYDPMGRVELNEQCTPRTCSSTPISPYSLQYNYDLAGALTSASDGVGHTFTYSHDQAGQMISTTGSWNDANHPAALVTNVKYGPFGVINQKFGNNVTEQRTYGPRSWVSEIAAAYNIADGTLIPEGVAASGAVMIGGSEQSKVSVTQPATASTGTVSISGSEQSKQVQVQSATSGSTTVNIAGTVRSKKILCESATGATIGQKAQPNICYQTVYDFGIVSFTVNGFTVSTTYQQNVTDYNVATALVSKLNVAASPVTASAVVQSQTGYSFSVTAKATGAATNYALSNSSVSNDTSDFPTGYSFSVSYPGSALTGGQDTIVNTIYDSGTITVSVNGHNASANWGNGSSTSSIASALSSSIQSQDGSFLSPTVSGASITLRSTGTGPSTNWPVTVSRTNDSANFPTPSFSVSGSGMTGGTDAQTVTLYDAGTVTLTVSGHSNSASYGQASTADGIASALANSVNADANAFVVATASGSTVSLGAKQTGTEGDYSLAVSASSSQGSNFSSPSFSITPSGNALTSGADGALYRVRVTYAPNGDVIGAHDSVMGPWTYVYDDLNRLKAAYQPGQGLVFSYDRYGNRWTQTVTAGSGGQPNISYTANSNRVSGVSYDAAGDVGNDVLNSYAYDGEGRISSVSGGTAESYIYDAEGRRASSQLHEYLYDLGGHPVSILDKTTGTLLYGEVYAGGMHIATYSNSTTTFHHMDWIGNERSRTGVNGTVTETCQNLPFGDSLICQGTEVSHYHFTGKERDDTGLDYFGARYYSSTSARWMTPDWSETPAPLPFIDISNPQSLNLYEYVGNNPLTKIDPDGHATDIGGYDPADQGQYDLEYEVEPASEEKSRQASTDPCAGKSNCVSVTAKPDPVQTQNIFTARWIEDRITAISAVIRTASSRTLRNIWMRYHQQPWPKTPEGQNYHAHHKQPLADGGDERDPTNIEPKEPQKHIDDHKDDFARWSRMREKVQMKAEEERFQEIMGEGDVSKGEAGITGEEPELPPIDIPEMPMK